MKERLERMIDMLKDDYNDAEMAYEYAKEEKEAENMEMASWYLTRARTRLDMFQKDDEKIQNIMREHESKTRSYDTEKHHEHEEHKHHSMAELWKCFYEDLIEEAHELSQKVSKFKM